MFSCKYTENSRYADRFAYINITDERVRVDTAHNKGVSDVWQGCVVFKKTTFPSKKAAVFGSTGRFSYPVRVTHSVHLEFCP
jgi:hypothetical protein